MNAATVDAYRRESLRRAEAQIRRASLGQPCTIGLPSGLLRGAHNGTFVRRCRSGRVEVAITVHPGRLVYVITEPRNVLTVGSK